MKEFIYCLSDNHINRSKFDSEKGKFTRENLENFMISIKEKIIENGKKEFHTVLFGGDTFDKFEISTDFRKWEYWFTNLINEFLEDLEKNKIKNLKTIIITGNHDCNNVSEYTAMSGFNIFKSRFIENGTLVVCEKELEQVKNGETVFTLAPFPFLHENRKDGEYLKELSKKKYLKGDKNILLSHFIIDGMNASNHEGFSYRNVHSTHNQLEDLGFDLVLLGDNHSHYENGKIVSIGSSEQHSFNEEGENKGIYLIEINNDKIKRKRDILEEPSIQKNTVRIDFKDTKNFEEMEDIFESKIQELEKNINGIEGKEIRIFFEIPFDRQNDFIKIKKKINSIEEKTCFIQIREDIIDVNSIEDLDDLEVDDLNNENSIIERYAEKILNKKDEKYVKELLERKSSILKRKDEVVEEIFQKMNSLNK